MSAAPRSLRILLLAPDDTVAGALGVALAAHRVTRATCDRDAAGLLGAWEFDCVVADAPADFLDVLRALAPAAAAVAVVPTAADARTALAQGAHDYLMVGHLPPTLVRAAVDVALERKADTAALAEAALHDPLTGVANRDLLVNYMHVVLARNARRRDRVAVLCADVDDLGGVNDRYGRDTGDEVLNAVAARIRSALRPYDTVGRLGGDEFVVVCEDIYGDYSVDGIAKRILVAVEEPLEAGGETLVVTACVGIVLADGVQDPDHLIRTAVAAGRRAKSAGHGRYEYALGAR